MELVELEVLDSSLSRMKWRLKHSSRRRLETDVVALCRGIRPVVMVDYGGKLPQLQHNLSALLQHCRNHQPGLPVFEQLRLMLIEDMIYLVHISQLATFVRSPQSQLLRFVDLQHDPPTMIKQDENVENPLVVQFVAIQNMFALRFPSSSGQFAEEVIDFSSCMQDTELTLPTLNGWLLGYPVVYLFSKDRAAEAIRNLSMKCLHVYTVSVRRPNNQSEVEELLSFSVPYGLSTRGSKEEWAQAFLAHLQEKWEGCKDAWKSFHLDVTELNPQAIVL